MASLEQSSEQARQAQDARLVVDTIPALAWSARADGSADFFNQRWLDYTGLSAEQARDWGWTVAVHPDDLKALVDYWRSVLTSGEPGEIEGRLRQFDGLYRWFLFRATPSFDSDAKIVKWFGTNTDIEDRKRAELLLAGENRVLEMIAKGNSLESILEGLGWRNMRLQRHPLAVCSTTRHRLSTCTLGMSPPLLVVVGNY